MQHISDLVLVSKPCTRSGHMAPFYFAVKNARTDVPLESQGPISFVNRPVRSRLPGGVGAEGEKPPATRLCVFLPFELAGCRQYAKER